MKQKNLIIIALILLLIFVAVDVVLYLVYFRDMGVRQTPIAVESPKPQTSNFEPSPQLAGVYYKEQALESNSLADCYEIDDLAAQGKCIDLVESENNDASSAQYCLSHLDEQSKYECVRNFANTKNRVQDCDLLSDNYKVLCYDYYANNRIYDGEVSVCNYISDEQRKQNCINKVYFYSGQCDKIADEDQRQICEVESPSI